MIRIKVIGLFKVLRLLDLPDRAVALAVRALAEETRTILATYPRSPTYPLRWASRAQRAYYFLLRRQYGLPYIRRSDPLSQGLGPSWRVYGYRRLGSVLSTTVSYAPFVQHEHWQQPFHTDTGWITDVKAIGRALRSGVMARVFKRALHRY